MAPSNAAAHARNRVHAARVSRIPDSAPRGRAGSVPGAVRRAPPRGRDPAGAVHGPFHRPSGKTAGGTPPAPALTGPVSTSADRRSGGPSTGRPTGPSRPTDPAHVGTARRWSMLAASTLAQAAAAVMMHGPAFLIPVLHEREGLSLAQAGLVAAAPTVGVMCTLVAWGMVGARGERFALLAGLVATTLAGTAAALVGGTPLLAATLFLAGASAASTSSASGRVVVGWFPPARRGLAMGIRQMAQPVGVGIAAVSIAVVADTHGAHAALWVPTLACAVAAVVVALVVVDPPRPDARAGAAAAANPYRRDGFLTRVHGVSVLLVVPQFLVWTFALVWLVQDRVGARPLPVPWSRAPRSRAPSAGSSPATSRTWSAAGCDRCAGGGGRGGGDGAARGHRRPRLAGGGHPPGRGHRADRRGQRPRVHRGRRAGRAVRSGRALGSRTPRSS